MSSTDIDAARVQPQRIRPAVRAAVPEDLESIIHLLAEDFQWKGSTAAIARLLGHSWGAVDLPRAMVVEADGRVVGFLATIFSPWPRTDRSLAEPMSNTEQIGTFSFYHVHPEFRAMSLPLLREALKLCRRWTSLSPNEYSQAILKLAGFRIVSRGFRFYHPLSAGFRRRGWWARRATAEDLSVAGYASVSADHARYGCSIFFAGNEAHRLVVITKRRPAGGGRVRLPISEVLFVSDRERLADAWPALLPIMLRTDRCVAVALDEYFDPEHKIQGGSPRDRIRVVRGLDESEQFDALYSELVLLHP